MLNIRNIVIILWCSIVESSHFYGGTVTWKPMNNTANGSTVAVMFIQSYQWRRSYTGAGCNLSTIINQTPLIPLTSDKLNCTTSSCGGYTVISINEYCTDFSSLSDSSSGQISSIENITAGSKFCVAYKGTAWIKLYSTSCSSSGRKKRASPWGTTTTVAGCYSTSAGWSIGTCVDLTVRSDGLINTPPVATIISPYSLAIKVPLNSLTNITIPVIDADNDFLRCRWAEQTTDLDECGDVCQAAPGSTLDEDSCTLTFNSTGKSVGDYFAVALMVEDFYNSTTNDSYSRVPIQFLICIVNQTTCSSKPNISSTLPECSPIQAGVPFNFSLSIVQGCAGTTITDVFTMPPQYMYKGSLTRNGTSNIWTLTEMWTPNATQLGSQVYCAIATDSANVQSDQYCTTFTVVPAGSVSLCPGETSTTSTTTTSSSTSIVTITSTNSSTLAGSTTETTTIITTTDNTTSTISDSTSTINVTTATTSSTDTSKTSTTAITTMSVTIGYILESTTAKKTNLPLIIGLSLLGLLALLALCCCCWWRLCCGTAGRRRRKRLEEKIKDRHIPFNKSSSNYRKPNKMNQISELRLGDNTSLRSRTTISSSFKYGTDQNLDRNTIMGKTKEFRYQRRTNSNGASIICTNQVKKTSIADTDNVSNTDLSKETIAKMPREINASTVPRSKSPAASVHFIKLPRAVSSNQPDRDGSLSVSTSKSSASLSKLKRSTTVNVHPQSDELKQNSGTNISVPKMKRLDLPLQTSNELEKEPKKCPSFHIREIDAPKSRDSTRRNKDELRPTLGQSESMNVSKTQRSMTSSGNNTPNQAKVENTTGTTVPKLKHWNVSSVLHHNLSDRTDRSSATTTAPKNVSSAKVLKNISDTNANNVTVPKIPRAKSLTLLQSAFFAEQ